MIKFYYDPIMGLVWWNIKPPFEHNHIKKIKIKKHGKK